MLKLILLGFGYVVVGGMISRFATDFFTRKMGVDAGDPAVVFTYALGFLAGATWIVSIPMILALSIPLVIGERIAEKIIDLLKSKGE